MSRLFARWIGRRRTLDGVSLVDRPVAGLGHSTVSGILRGYVVAPEKIHVREEMTTDWWVHLGATNNKHVVVNQVMVTNVTDSAVNAYVALMSTASGTPSSVNAFLLWGTTIAARSYYLWEGICPLDDTWIYGQASAADSLIFSCWGQYADFYE